MKMWNNNIIEKTTDYVIIGNQGLKIIVSGSVNFIGPQISDLSDIAGKILKFSCDISNPKFDVKISFKQHNGTTYTSTQFTTVSSGSSTHAEVSTTIENDTTMIWLRIENTSSTWPTDGIFYTDNWCLEEI